MNLRRTAVLILLAIAAGVVAWFGLTIRQQRQWHDQLDQQLATIRRLEAFPPEGWSAGAWRSALLSPYNVWGNALYTPDYSGLSNAEMRAIQAELDVILAETTSENSIESVDRIYDLLLEHSDKTEFITGYRDEIREYDQRIGVQTE